DVRAVDDAERAAAVVGAVQLHAEHVDAVLVVRVDADLAEHPAVRAADALHVLILLADPPPRRAPVIRAVDRGAADDGRSGPAVRVGLARTRLPCDLVVVDPRVQHVGVRARDVDADAAAELRRRQPLVDRLPRLAAIRAAVDAAAVVAGLDARVVPLATRALPGRGVQHVRIARIHDEVVRARLLVDVQHLAPRAAAVRRLEDAAVRVARPLHARCRDPDDVGVRRMYEDTADRVRARESHVLPRLTTVRGLVDAGARVRAAEDVRLARAHPQDVRIRRREREIADGRRRRLLEDRLPRHTLVHGLPHAARRARHVHRVALPLRLD